MVNNIIRCVLLGNSGVGKSSILDRLKGYEFNDFNCSTVGVDFGIIKNQTTNIKYHIYDTSGQCAYKSITNQYYRDATIVLFVYDLSDNKSMIDLKYWEKEFDEKNDNNKLKIFIGNKKELKKVDNNNVIKEINNKKHIHIEISAKNNYNIDTIKDIIINYVDETINLNNLNNLNKMEKSLIEDNYYYKINNVSTKKKNNCC